MCIRPTAFSTTRSRRMARRAAMTARKLTPLTKNAHPGPTRARMTPPIAGPKARAALNWAEFSVTALSSASRGTSSETNACHEPIISPANTPEVAAMAMITPGDRTPAPQAAPQGHRHRGLGRGHDQQYGAAVEAVGQGPADGSQYRGRDEEAERGEAHPCRAVGQAEHDVGHGDVLDPAPGVGDDGPGPEQGEVPVPERGHGRTKSGTDLLFDVGGFSRAHGGPRLRVGRRGAVRSPTGTTPR